MTNEELQAELAKYPKDAKVATDVGASMFSGWGEIIAVTYHERYNTIELEAS